MQVVVVFYLYPTIVEAILAIYACEVVDPPVGEDDNSGCPI